MPLTLTRSLLVVLVPGIVALAPWILLLVVLSPSLRKGYSGYTVPANAVLFAAVAVVGSVLEGLATVVEDRWDKQCEKELGVREHWFAYLARTGPEPVGHRYLSRMVTTLYFELAMLFASVLFLVGAAAAVWASNVSRPGLLSSALIGAAIATGFYFRWQARQTHRVLCEVRRELATRVRPSTAIEGTQLAEGAA